MVSNADGALAPTISAQGLDAAENATSGEDLDRELDRIPLPFPFPFLPCVDSHLGIATATIEVHAQSEKETGAEHPCRTHPLCHSGRAPIHCDLSLAQNKIPVYR